MPRTAEQNERIRQATRIKILNGAMLLFARGGYSHTTTRQIAEQAGVSIGLMYHYFDSKESLLQSVFDDCMATLSSAFSDAYSQSQPGNRLAGVLQTIFDILETDREFWSLFYMLRSQPAIMNILGDSFLQWTARLRDMFVFELRNSGRNEPEVDALILYSLIEGTIQQYLLDPTSYPLEVVASRIIEKYGS